MTAFDVVQVTSYLATHHGCEQVFFTGSFACPSSVRFLITRQFTLQNLFQFTAKGLVRLFTYYDVNNHTGQHGTLKLTLCKCRLYLWFLILFKGDGIKFDFVKPPSHLAAIGALVGPDREC